MSHASGLEALEHRRLFASTLLADVSLTSRGTLTIQGTRNADTISVSKDGDTVTAVVRNGAGDEGTFTFAADRVKQLYLEGAAGNDRIELGGTWTRPATLVGGAGKDSLFDQTSTKTGYAGRYYTFRDDDNKLRYSLDFDADYVAPIFFTLNGKTSVRPFVLSGGAGDDLIEIAGPVRSVDGGRGADYLSAPPRAREASLVSGAEVTITYDDSPSQPDGVTGDWSFARYTPSSAAPRYLVATDPRTGRPLFNAESIGRINADAETPREIELTDQTVIVDARPTHPRGG